MFGTQQMQIASVGGKHDSRLSISSQYDL